MYQSETQLQSIKPNSNGGVPSRTASSVQPKYDSKKRSQPLRIKFENQKSDVRFGRRDTNKWSSGEKLRKTPDTRQNAEAATKEFIDTIQNPDEDGDRLSFIADNETGKGYLGSYLTKEEYLPIKETGEIGLFDLRRDPQTLVINKKSIQESDSLFQAKQEGHLDDYTDIRRPHNLFESNADFIGLDSDGSPVDVEFKAISQEVPRPINKQVKEVNLIKSKLKGTSLIDPKTEKITFKDLEFDKTKPVRIKIADSLSFPKEI